MHEMKVTVLYGAQLSEAAGGIRETVELDDGASVGDLLRLLASRHGPRFSSALESLGQRLLILVNGMSSSYSDKLSDGDFVSLLPPVSGG